MPVGAFGGARKHHGAPCARTATPTRRARCRAIRSPWPRASRRWTCWSRSTAGRRLEALGAELERLLQPVLATGALPGAPGARRARSSGCHFTKAARRAPRRALTEAAASALRGAVPRHVGSRHLPAAFRRTRRASCRWRTAAPTSTRFAQRAAASRCASACDMKATRVFQLTALALVVVAAVQVGLVAVRSARLHAIEKVRAARTAYAEQTARRAGAVRCGRRLRSACSSCCRASSCSGGRAALSAAARRRRSRARSAGAINQYAWEGGVLPAGARGLHRRDRCARCGPRPTSSRSRTTSSRSSRTSSKPRWPACSSRSRRWPCAPCRRSQARTLIDRMLVGSGAHGAMVTQILESVRLERGRVDFKAEPLELSGAVARVVAQFEERARKDNITITSRHRSAACTSSTDPLALDVVVRNRPRKRARGRQRRVGGGTHRVHRARASDGEIELVGARQRSRVSAPRTARGCSRSSRACTRAAAAATTAPGSACSSCGV